jgi:hypothetical protein
MQAFLDSVDARRSARAAAAWALSVALSALLVACGGGGGVDSGGTGSPSTVAVGPISGFGSIVVAGVHFTGEDAAEIRDDDGAPLAAEDLTLGQSVRVEGSPIVDAGGRLESTASAIVVEQRVVGPVEAVDLPTGRLRVLGQDVSVDAQTAFDPALVGGLAALAPGRLIAVAGTLDRGRTRIVATRIAPRDAVGAYALRAVVESVDGPSTTAVIGGLSVDLSGLSPAPSAADLGIGTEVRVRLATTPGAKGWVAIALRTAEVTLETHEFVEIEGRISRVVSGTLFEVDGVPIDATEASFPDGSAGLALGARVEVEGRARDGAVTASVVKIQRPSDPPDDEAIELEGRISDLDPVARQFVVRGVRVAWNDGTRFEGGGADDLRDERRVAVKGRLGPDGTLVVATSIHVEL